MTQQTGHKGVTFVKLDESHRELLRELAESEGTTISALLRRAVITYFNLPTGSQKLAVNSHISAGAVSITREAENVQPQDSAGAE